MSILLLDIHAPHEFFVMADICPILEELILENGGTQQEIDNIKNAQTGQDTGTENP